MAHMVGELRNLPGEFAGLAVLRYRARVAPPPAPLDALDVPHLPIAVLARASMSRRVRRESERLKLQARTAALDGLLKLREVDGEQELPVS
eukprot:12458780-Heterocapsa_arctica.AAC.1